MDNQSEKKRLVLAGGSGFLGQALAQYFIAKGFDVVVLSRSGLGNKDGIRFLPWDAKTLGEWTEEIDGAYAVINLTGRSVDCRYNETNKAAILSSRLDSTHVIGEAITQCGTPPRIWMNASSATIYRESFDTDMDEDVTDLDTHGFSENVVLQWEAAQQQYPCPFTRKVALRISIVMGNGGGAMGPLKMLTGFFLGGRQGPGTQYMSWLHMDDFINSVDFIMQHDTLDGAINICSPNPLPNAACMAALRRAMHRPFGLPHPRWALEIGAFIIRTETELLLKSRRVVPKRLLDAGFEFQYPNIEEAFNDLV